MSVVTEELVKAPILETLDHETPRARLGRCLSPNPPREGVRLAS